ncbi:glycosyltransferase, partial [Thermodesulfobacteriota bacterium]
ASKIIPIYNPIEVERVTQRSHEKIEHLWYDEKVPIIISIGRLTPQKGFSHLIKALAIVKKSGISCRLVILGEGKENSNLRKLAKKLRINDSVAFLGFQRNPYKYLRYATIFVLSSLYEGFPNVLLEALALGVPSVATRCPTGPTEIITDGVDGILVPSADHIALADAIKQLLLDSNLRKQLREKGKKRVVEFRVEKIIRQYEEVIEAVCGA